LAAFWAWFHDARDIVEGGAEPQGLVRELVNGERDRIDDLARRSAQPESARLTLETAVALVGFHYASMQKLLEGLKAEGVFQAPRELPAFDTVAAPPVED
jgi:hypothetical protein